MSNAQKAQDFVTSFMKNLAEGVELTSSLQAVFAKILAEQVVVDADTNVVNFKPAFSTLLKVLTFIATPEDKRPEAGYTQEAIDTAADSAAAETDLELGGDAPVDPELPTDEPTEEPTDGPTDEPTDEPTDGPTDEPTEEPGIEGNTLELTTGADVIAPLAEGEEAVEGVLNTTENDDVINGLAGTYATTTLNKDDQIDGGAGHDTLNVTLNSKFGGFSGEGFLKNVEVVNLTNEGKSNRAFEAKQVEGVQTYNLDGLVELNNLATADVAINVANREAGNLKIVYADKVTDSTADVLNLGLTNVGTTGVTDAAGKVTTKEEIVKVEAAGIETLNLNAVGANLVDLTSVAAAKAINIAGAGSLKLNGLQKDVKEVDASGLEGKLNLNLGAVAKGLTTVNGGAGDDVITANVGSLATSAKINGGEGKDTLVLKNIGDATATTTLQLQMEGVETIKLDTLASGGLTYSAAKTAGLENLEVTGVITGNALFAGMEGDLNVTLNKATSGSVSADNDGATKLTISSTGATKALPAAAVTTETSFTKSVNVDITVDAFNSYTGKITASAAEAASLTLNGSVATTATLELGAAQSLVINDNNAVADTLVLDAAKLEELTVNVKNAGTTAIPSNFTLAGTSTLTGLKALNVTTNGLFDASTTIALDAVADLNLMGTGSVKLNTLGTAKSEDSITLTAVGLADGLTVAAINTGIGNSIDINVAEVLGAVTQSGGITVANDSDGKKTGSISIEADGTMGEIVITSLKAKEVSFNAADALGNVSAATAAGTALKIDAETVNFIGSGLGVNNVQVTAQKATIVGGIQVDKIEVIGEAKASTIAGATVGEVAAFELTGGLGDDTFKITASAANVVGNGQMVVTITDFAAGKDILEGAGSALHLGSNFALTGALTTSTGTSAGALSAFVMSSTGLITAGVNSSTALKNAGKVEFVTDDKATAFFAAFNAFDGVSGLSKDNTKLATVDINGSSDGTGVGTGFALGLLDNGGNFYTFNALASASASVLVKLVGVDTVAEYDFAVMPVA